MKMTNFKNSKKISIYIIFTLIFLITGIIIYRKSLKGDKDETETDLETHFKRGRESENKDLMIGLSFLFDFSKLVYRYSGENLYLNNLKLCFNEIKYYFLKNNKLARFSGLNLKHCPLLSQYPDISPYTEYIHNIGEHIQSMEDLETQKKLEQMFSFTGECEKYMDKNYPKNIFMRDQFVRFSTNFYKPGLSGQMAEGQSEANKIFKTQMPKYFIPNIMRGTVKNKKDNHLDLESCSTLNLFDLKKYKINSLHARKEIKNGTESKSYQASPIGEWSSLDSGYSIGKKEICTVLNDPEYFLIFIYEEIN